MTAETDRRRQLALLAVVLLIAAGLRLWGIQHGLPRNFVPDSTVVRAALSLGSGQNPFTGDALPTQYPYFLPYVLFVLYGLVFAAGWAVGVFADVAAFGAWAIVHPERFFLLARLVVAGSGVLLVGLVVDCGRRLAGWRPGLTAGALAATSLLLVQMSQQARPHLVATTAVMACLWFCLRFREGRRELDLTAAWVMAGVAGSTVPYGFMSIVLPVAVTLGAGDLGWRRWRTAVVGGGLLILVTVLCYPKLVIGAGDAFAVDRASGQVRYFGGLYLNLGMIDGSGFLKLARWLLLSEPLLAVAAAMALPKLVSCPHTRRRWWIVLVFPAIFVLAYGSYRVIHPRYLVPVLPFLSLLGGAALWSLVERVGRHRGRPWLTPALLVAVFALPVVQAARLDVLLARTDTRLEAAAWIEDNVPATTVVALEPHGVDLEVDLATLASLSAAERRRLGTVDRYRLDHPSVGPSGRRVVRLWHVEPAPATADGLRRELAARYLVAVVDGATPRTDGLYADVRASAKLVARFSPLVDGGTRAETKLPRELHNPLVGLWRVERCGPIVEIFDLGGGS